MAGPVFQFGIDFLGALIKRGAPRIGSAVAVNVLMRLAIPVFRTAGLFQNRLLRGIFGREPTPAERLLAGVTSGFPTYVNPFFTAFLSGAAYENNEELAEGWLSFFGELLLSPVIETDATRAIKKAGEKDFFAVMDALAELASDELGLEDLAAVFRGIGKAASDFEALTGIALPLNYIGELIIWLDRALQGHFDPFPLPPETDVRVGAEEERRRGRTLTEFLAGQAPPPREPEIPPEITPIGEPVPITLAGAVGTVFGSLFTISSGKPVALRTGRAQIKLTQAVRGVSMELIARARRARGPQEFLFEIGKTVSEAVKEKIRRLVLGT